MFCFFFPPLEFYGVSPTKTLFSFPLRIVLFFFPWNFWGFLPKFQGFSIFPASNFVGFPPPTLGFPPRILTGFPLLEFRGFSTLECLWL